MSHYEDEINQFFFIVYCDDLRDFMTPFTIFINISETSWKRFEHFFNQFQANVLFLQHLKTLEDQRFSDVFRGHRKRTKPVKS